MFQGPQHLKEAWGSNLSHLKLRLASGASQQGACQSAKVCSTSRVMSSGLAYAMSIKQICRISWASPRDCSVPLRTIRIPPNAPFKNLAEKLYMFMNYRLLRFTNDSLRCSVGGLVTSCNPKPAQPRPAKPHRLPPNPKCRQYRINVGT